MCSAVLFTCLCALTLFRSTPASPSWVPPPQAYVAFLMSLSNCVGRPHQRPTAPSSTVAGSVFPPAPSTSTSVAWHDVDDNIRDVRRVVCEMVTAGVPLSVETLCGGCSCWSLACNCVSGMSVLMVVIAVSSLLLSSCVDAQFELFDGNQECDSVRLCMTLYDSV